MVKNNAVHAQPTGGEHWLEFMPDHVYCFLPSFENKGTVLVYDHMPEFIRNFFYCMEIQQVVATFYSKIDFTWFPYLDRKMCLISQFHPN